MAWEGRDSDCPWPVVILVRVELPIPEGALKGIIICTLLLCEEGRLRNEEVMVGRNGMKDRRKKH